MRVNLALAILLTVLAACSDRSFTPTVPEALNIGTNQTVFAATSRLPEADGNFGFRRSNELRLLELTVSIPPDHQPGMLDFGYANPDPYTQFTMAGRREFATSDAFAARLRETMQAIPSQQREVTIFVHGFNATQSETAFRAAQLAKDVGLPGATLVYSWPSKGKALAYAYDNDSALFARDGLERVIRGVKSGGAERVVLVAHSIGSLVTMETLRQIDIKEPGWVARNLGGVILISPDLDIEVFRSQMNRLSKVPQPFVVFVSQKDRALNLSARLRGSYNPQRLGTLSNIQHVSDLPIHIINTTEFSRTAGSSHFVPATSPALLAMMQGANSVSRTFGKDPTTIETRFAGVEIRSGKASESILRFTEEDRR